MQVQRTIRVKPQNRIRFPRGTSIPTNPTRSMPSTSTGTGANPAASAPPSAPGSASALDAEGNPVVDNPERCTGCRWCELHCPDFAICVREVEKGQETTKE